MEFEQELEIIPEMTPELEQVLSAFGLSAVKSLQALHVGHINDSFIVENSERRYILQRLNPDVFTRGEEVMENIIYVTDFLREQIAARGGNPDRETLTLIKTTNDKSYRRSADGHIWRCYDYIESTVCFLAADSSERIHEAARCYGQFHADLANFPMQQLHETIVNFHNTEERYRQFLAALEADPLQRTVDCRPEIDFVLERSRDVSYLLDLERCGTLVSRVTHNDTKLSNVLFDASSNRAITVIDLDTLMPGLLAFDFGDIVRSGATYAEEDERDLSKVKFDPQLYRAIHAGFVEGIGDGITTAELKSLPWGARLMTLECGMRFLADYLLGDKYFHIIRPSQNLDRARTQFKLVADMEEILEF